MASDFVLKEFRKFGTSGENVWRKREIITISWIYWQTRMFCVWNMQSGEPNRTLFLFLLILNCQLISLILDCRLPAPRRLRRSITLDECLSICNRVALSETKLNSHSFTPVFSIDAWMNQGMNDKGRNQWMILQNSNLNPACSQSEGDFIFDHFSIIIICSISATLSNDSEWFTVIDSIYLWMQCGVFVRPRCFHVKINCRHSSAPAVMTSNATIHAVKSCDAKRKRRAKNHQKIAWVSFAIRCFRV